MCISVWLDQHLPAACSQGYSRQAVHEVGPGIKHPTEDLNTGERARWPYCFMGNLLPCK